MLKKRKLIEKIKENKIKSLILFLGVFMVMGVSAVLVFNYAGSMTGQVVSSNEELLIITDLSNFLIDASNGDVEYLSNLSLQNNDGEFLFDLNLTSIKTPEDPLCPNYESDCDVIFLYQNGTEILNGGDVLMQSGINDFVVQTSCLSHSCPQEILISVRLDPQ